MRYVLMAVLIALAGPTWGGEVMLSAGFSQHAHDGYRADDGTWQPYNERHLALSYTAPNGWAGMVFDNSYNALSVALGRQFTYRVSERWSLEGFMGAASGYEEQLWGSDKLTLFGWAGVRWDPSPDLSVRLLGQSQSVSLWIGLKGTE